MSLIFKSGQYLKTIYHNSISTSDLTVPGLTENRESVLLTEAEMSVQNWCFDGIRLVRFVLNQKQETQYEIRNDIDAVKIYFNRRGVNQSDYKQISKKVLLLSGQFNMMYSDELDTSVSHMGNNSEIFSLQFTRTFYLELMEQTGISMDQFNKHLKRKQPILFSNYWLTMNSAMDNCINDIVRCPFRSEMRKMYLHSKAIELFLLFLNAADKTKPTDFQIRNSDEREKLYYAREYLANNFANPNSLTNLSKICGLNEFKLKQGFKLLFNSPVIEFLVNYRLEQAHNLLLDSQKSISEIAFETGYSSPSYFAKAFKKKYGYSPGKR